MLSGFLGSGKTSCVISLAAYLSSLQEDHEIKLAVIIMKYLAIHILKWQNMILPRR